MIMMVIHSSSLAWHRHLIEQEVQQKTAIMFSFLYAWDFWMHIKHIYMRWNLEAKIRKCNVFICWFCYCYCCFWVSIFRRGREDQLLLLLLHVICATCMMGLQWRLFTSLNFHKAYFIMGFPGYCCCTQMSLNVLDGLLLTCVIQTFEKKNLACLLSSWLKCMISKHKRYYTK